LPHVCTVDTGRIGDEIAIFVLFPETKLSIEVLIRNDLVLILVVKYLGRSMSVDAHKYPTEVDGAAWKYSHHTGDLSHGAPQERRDG
jgi:hypothetical protein